MNENLPQEAPKKKLLMVKQEQIIRGNNQQAPSSASSGLAPNQEVSKLICWSAENNKSKPFKNIWIFEWTNWAMSKEEKSDIRYNNEGDDNSFVH